MTNKIFKAVCFDFGGVIELNGGERISERIAKVLSVPLTNFKKEYFKYNHLSNVEGMSWENMIIKVVSVFDNNDNIKDKVLSLVREFNSKKKINFELLTLFPKLQQQGFKVAIFSNNTSKMRDTLNANGITNLVDKIVISSEIGFQKPDKEAFEELFEKLGVRPEEVIFVDDTPESLEKSDEIGYTPILFMNNEQLKVDLKNLGICL